MLKKLFKQIVGKEPAKIEKLAGAGSNRQYFRLYDDLGISFIGCIGTSKEENHAFVSLSYDFEKKQLPVPRVLAVSEDEMCYIQEDLGTMSLFDAIAKGRKQGDYNEDEKVLLRNTIRLLPHFQILGGDELDFSVCYPQPEFDRQNVFFDLNYFKYSFLKTQNIDFHEIKLEHDFNLLADSLLKKPEYWVFMYRDFQARNVMLQNNNPVFIDYQGGRRGPIYYDVASFLWQASAHYSNELRQELIKAYYEELTCICPAIETLEEFTQHLNTFVLFRTLQVLGAYGFRGRFERKQHFLDSIPGALQNLQELLDNGVCNPYPYLKEVCRRMISAQPKPFYHEGLVVRVYSFSYKKGIPEDVSGNGGGYVFDCRSTNNPGRYKEYKHSTGRDKDVIDFLEKDGEILRFLDNIYPLVDFHTQRWLDRGFKDLQISFGCTGGQHRSVYSAEHVAHHLHDKFGVKVLLCHREQNIHEEL